MEIEILTRLSTLGHPHRLALFRLLMRRYPDHVPATELARALGLKPNTLSTYVNALRQAGLVTQKRVGTSLRYAIDMGAARETFDYLLRDCCRGRPDICAPATRDSADTRLPRPDGKQNVLFICTGNSARSILAETILRDAAGDRFNVYSAGTRPASQVNPLAVQVLRDKGHDVAGLRPKPVSEFSGPDAPPFDFVFTVCDLAANEDCAAWNGQPITGHWGVPAPTKGDGDDGQAAQTFQRTYDHLKARIDRFTTVDPKALNPVALQAHVDDIGKLSFEEA